MVEQKPVAQTKMEVVRTLVAVLSLLVSTATLILVLYTR